MPTIKRKAKIRNAKKKSRTAKPLLRTRDAVRKTKSRVRRNDGVRAFSTNPVAMMALPGIFMREVATLPLRLARCRTPLDLWQEQWRFSQRMFALAFEGMSPPGRR
jgi:hypothetical protein